jgi:starvation-inducible DNA-binding protein
LKTLYYHWNVTGPNFKSLHELFEEHYENLHEAGDEIAERIRSIGYMTPGTIDEFRKLTCIKEDSQLPESWQIMVSNLVEGNETASKSAREVMKLAEKYEDEVTIDMMVARMKFHDEASWMLRSTIEGS